MSRISIDVTPEQHQRLKAMAALQGMTIKQFVLASTLDGARPNSEDRAALAELEAVLIDRLAKARKGGVSDRTVEEIFEQARRDTRRGPDA